MKWGRRVLVTPPTPWSSTSSEGEDVSNRTSCGLSLQVRTFPEFRRVDSKSPALTPVLRCPVTPGTRLGKRTIFESVTPVIDEALPLAKGSPILWSPTPHAGHGLPFGRLCAEAARRAVSNVVYHCPAEGYIDPRLLGAAWLLGHVPMVLSQAEPRGLPGYDITRPDGEKKFTWIKGEWRSFPITAGVKENLWVFIEQDLTDEELHSYTLGFGRIRFLTPADLQWMHLVDPTFRPGLPDEDEDGPLWDISKWPITVLSPRKLDYQLGNPHLWAPTRQAIQQWLARPDVAAIHMKVARYTTCQPGGPEWEGGDKETFHVAAHYLPGTDELVCDGTTSHEVWPGAIGIPAWLAPQGAVRNGRSLRVGGRRYRSVITTRFVVEKGPCLRRQKDGSFKTVIADRKVLRDPRLPLILKVREREDMYGDPNDDPAPECFLRSQDQWLLPSVATDGTMGHDDQVRAERPGIDYTLVEEDRLPDWGEWKWDADKHVSEWSFVKSYTVYGEEDQPNVLKAIEDGLKILNQLTKLAEDAEAAWLQCRKTRKTKHRRIKEDLATWRGRVTKDLVRALKADLPAEGKDQSTGQWLLEELTAQKERALKALDKKSRPKAMVQDRVEELKTDLAYVWEQLRDSNGDGRHMMMQDEQWLDILSQMFEEAICFRLAVLSHDRKRKPYQVMKQALIQGKKEGLFSFDAKRLGALVEAEKAEWDPIKVICDSIDAYRAS